MRHLISGVVAAVAVMAASPAMAACGYSSCSPCGYSYSPCVQPQYVAPVATYSYGYGCGTGCGWAAARLAEPTTQYYYVNQGPTYSGPGAWAPQPAYYEPSVSGWSNYARPYNYGYVARPRYWGPRAFGYGYRAYRPYAHRYGYAHRHYGMRHAVPYHYGRPLRRYY
ncbi:hypothetical protein [Bradyrhizobium sp.]|uniref:hypothetical protein n=1 Tax=Bradyrhizobium sp. TaxID=376 RepID=UPI0040382768